MIIKYTNRYINKLNKEVDIINYILNCKDSSYISRYPNNKSKYSVFDSPSKSFKQIRNHKRNCIINDIYYHFRDIDYISINLAAKYNIIGYRILSGDFVYKINNLPIQFKYDLCLNNLKQFILDFNNYNMARLEKLANIS